MKIIKTQRDLEAINSSQNLSKSVLEAVQKYFRDSISAVGAPEHARPARCGKCRWSQGWREAAN